MKTGKLLRVCFCLLVVGSFSHAQEAKLAPLSLASTMKAMGNKFKQLASQLNNPALNARSAQLAEEIATGAIASKAYDVKKFSNLPEEEKAFKKQQYDQMLDRTAELCVEMARLLRANDNAQAQALFNQINQEKKESHAEFK